MPTSADIPSCRRVPPERTSVSSGRRSATAVRAAATSAVASSSPKLPPNTEKSQAAQTGPVGSRQTVTAVLGS
jgi:hypothetical protein